MSTTSKLRSLERAYLISGEDASLVGQALSALLDELGELGDLGTEAIEEYTLGNREETSVVSSVLDACQTPPFLTPRRIVVVREAELLTAGELAEVTSYLAEPLETTTLVLAVGGRRALAALSKAVAACGKVIAAAPATTTRARNEWFTERIRGAPVRLSSSAAQLLQRHLGEDLARLDGVLDVLAAAYGDGATLDDADVTPFLGEAGSVAPWDLTDAIDAGDGHVAITCLHRMLEGGERHPLQILATLHRHYAAMLALDGADVADETDAARVTKLRPFPAKKALLQSRRLGHDRIARAVLLLGAADLDLRGQSGLPPELNLEILTARLSQQSRRPARPARRSAARGSH